MYGKLFKTTFTGSLYGAGSKVLIVWCWIIANKDKTGRIEINPEELAHRIGDMTPEKHGLYSAEARAERRSMRQLLGDSAGLMKQMRKI